MSVDVDHRSRAQRLADAGRLKALVDSMTPEEAVEFAYDWDVWRRPDQAMPEPGWRTWMIRAGRGYGKTRTGAETIRELVEKHGYMRLGAVAPTAGDARDVMVEGESGILAVCPPNFAPVYEPSKRRLTWPNGAVCTLYSGDKPDRLRGPQHEAVWIDEPASMPRGKEALDNVRFGLRLGRPLLIVTGTPRPLKWLKALQEELTTITTTGSTYDNLRNLAPEFIELMIGMYEGTRLGRQELHAEYLEDVEGALWTQMTLDLHRFVAFDPAHPDAALRAEMARLERPIEMIRDRPWRTIIAVDPPAETAECGITVGTAPTHARAGRDHAVVLADETVTGRPEEWGQAVVAAYRHWGAQAVYVEANQGGDMTRSTIHAVDPTVVVKKIRAGKSKKARAEPVSALYEGGWVHHVGFFPKLEDQQTTWVQDESRSPDRLDAVVHLITELLPDGNPAPSKTGKVTGRSI